MQQEHVKVEAQEIGSQRRPQAPARPGDGARNLRQKSQQQGREQRESGAGPEQGRHAEMRCEQGPDYHCDHEGQADTDAEQRHRPGAHLFAGRIGNERRERRRNRARPLQETPRDHTVDRVRHGRKDAASRKDQESADDDGQPADTIGQRAEWHLEAGLRQAVGADGESDQHGRRVTQVGRIQRQDRQEREQAEHADHGDQRNYADRAALAGGHHNAVTVPRVQSRASFAPQMCGGVY